MINVSRSYIIGAVTPLRLYRDLFTGMDLDTDIDYFVRIKIRLIN